MRPARTTDFYPRPPRGGRRWPCPVRHQRGQISIHALCEEGDDRGPHTRAVALNFYPRPLRGGRRELVADALKFEHISIHALCEEGDYLSFAPVSWISYFYPRPLRGGRPQHPLPDVAFLSTPSARRATAAIELPDGWEDDFYPRPLRGGRLHDLRHPVQQNQISIHALREEGDVMFQTLRAFIRYFYPRPPRGGRRL